MGRATADKSAAAEADAAAEDGLADEATTLLPVSLRVDFQHQFRLLLMDLRNFMDTQYIDDHTALAQRGRRGWDARQCFVYPATAANCRAAAVSSVLTDVALWGRATPQLYHTMVTQMFQLVEHALHLETSVSAATRACAARRAREAVRNVFAFLELQCPASAVAADGCA